MQFIWKSGLWKVNLPIPGSEKKGTGGKYQVKKEVKYKEFVGTKKQIKVAERKNKIEIEKLEIIEQRKISIKYQKERHIENKKKIVKFLKYKKYFNTKFVDTKNFEKNLSKYASVYSEYHDWRKNFKYPELTYLQRLEFVNPVPSEDLIKKLANCIGELSKIYIELKDYRAVIIFKLFIHYISQCIKVSCKIKFHKKGYNWGGSVSPSKRDVDEIGSLIAEYFANIKDTEDDPKANEYSCGCGKLKGKKNWYVTCKNPDCHTYAEINYRKPWDSEPKSVSISATEDYMERKDYNKSLKEFKKLINIKNKNLIQTIKYPHGKGSYKISIVENLVKNFFNLNYHLDENELNKILNISKDENKEKDQKKDRIILNKSDKELELYWGEIKNDKPNGKGVSEKYETDEHIKKIFNKVGPVWWKMYSKNLKAKDLKGYIILEKYEGEWKDGKKHGKGVLTIFIDPAYVSNRNNTPKIQNQYKGNFIDNLLDGEIKEYDDIENEWTTHKYKMGKKIKIRLSSK